MEEIQLAPFTYPIRSQDVSEELVKRFSFSIIDIENGAWIMQAPEQLSATKARKVISTMINLLSSAREIARAQNRYDELYQKLEELRLSL